MLECKEASQGFPMEPPEEMRQLFECARPFPQRSSLSSDPLRRQEDWVKSKQPGTDVKCNERFIVFPIEPPIENATVG